MSTADGVTLRTELRPGDVGSVIALHGLVYAREYGFDPSFEAYVAGPLADFVIRASPRERLWLAERAGAVAGCIAIAAESDAVAQLRWFLVAPSARGAGLGRRLLDEALTFSRAAGYERMILWTVSALEVAIHLYRSAGFTRVEQVPAERWGARVVEEKYEMEL